MFDVRQRGWIAMNFSGLHKAFALRVLKLVEQLPRTTAGRVIGGNQLARSATSVGANYRAACRSRSRAEFAAKLGIVAEEADESLFLARNDYRRQLHRKESS